MFETEKLIKYGVNLEKSLELFGEIYIYNDNLDEFLDSIINHKNNLINYKNGNDYNNYQKTLATLKNVSKNYGFTKLLDLSLNQENYYTNKEMDKFNSNHNALIDEITLASGVIKEYLGLDKESNENIHYNKSILVVDDSSVISTFVSKIFKNSYDILVAHNGEEAINMLSIHGNDIVGMLLDLNMPKVSGYEVLRFMKTNEIFKNINVAIITGVESKEVLENTREYPIKAILEKPFNEVNIKRVVNELLTK